MNVSTNNKNKDKCVQNNRQDELYLGLYIPRKSCSFSDILNTILEIRADLI